MMASHDGSALGAQLPPCFGVFLLPVFFIFTVALFFVAAGCSVFSAFFVVRPVALGVEVLFVRGFVRTEGGCHGARFVDALLVGLAARRSGRSLYSLRSLELPATTVGEWRRRHSLRRHKAGPGPQL